MTDEMILVGKGKVSPGSVIKISSPPGDSDQMTSHFRLLHIIRYEPAASKKLQPQPPA